MMELIVNSCEVLNKCCKNVYFYIIKLGNIVRQEVKSKSLCEIIFGVILL